MAQSIRYADIINEFRNKHVLVIGDLMLDVYLKGSSTRLSPEAPVPVVDVTEKIIIPGGAANTACNLRSLGAHVTYCTVTGNDPEGAEALRLLTSPGIAFENVLRHPQRKTLVKTRIVAGGQVIARFDSGTQTPIDDETGADLVKSIESAYPCYDAIVLSDYNKGIFTEGLLEAIHALQQRHSKCLAVDSKRLPFFAALNPAIVKPNYEEAVTLLNIPRKETGRAEQLSNHGKLLHLKTSAGIVALTLDDEGSVIFENGKVLCHTKAPVVPFAHVAGAGDTYISAFILAYCSCKELKPAAEIATAAATLAVQKESTSSCEAAELKHYFNTAAKHIDSLNDLRQLCENYRSKTKRIVLTNGCFDILHSGHVTYLRCAKELGDILIVGLNTDESITRIKGEGRPVNKLEDRIQVLSALSSVDYIIPFGDPLDDTPTELIKAAKPDIFVKGGDYTKEKLPEAATVEEEGGTIVFLPHIPDRSTTSIIQKIAHPSRKIPDKIPFVSNETLG